MSTLAIVPRLYYDYHAEEEKKKIALKTLQPNDILTEETRRAVTVARTQEGRLSV